MWAHRYTESQDVRLTGISYLIEAPGWGRMTWMHSPTFHFGMPTCLTAVATSCDSLLCWSEAELCSLCSVLALRNGASAPAGALICCAEGCSLRESEPDSELDLPKSLCRPLDRARCIDCNEREEAACNRDLCPCSADNDGSSRLCCASCRLAGACACKCHIKAFRDFEDLTPHGSRKGPHRSKQSSPKLQRCN